MARTKILIVEDRRQTAELLVRQISTRPDWALAPVADCLNAGLEALARVQPRIVVTDLGLPDGSGIEIVKACAAADWPCDAIVVSVMGDEKTVVDAIRAGARGYVLKFEILDRAVEVVQSVLDGSSPISPQVARHLLNHVEPGTPDLPDAPDLTRREIEILRLISRGFRREEVAARLDISVSTVGTHVNSVYRKLEVRSNVEAVTIAARLGLI